MLAMVRPFMSRKLMERVHLYGDSAEDMLRDAGVRPDQVTYIYI